MNTLRRLYPYLRPYRKRLILALAVTSLFTLLSLLPPLLMRALTNDIVQQQNWGLLPAVIGAIILVPIMAGSLRFVNVFSIMLMSQGLLASIRKQMYEKTLRLSMRYHSENAAGTVVSRIMDDVNMLQRVLTDETVRLLVDVIVFFFSVGVVFSISPTLGAILAFLLVLYVFSYRHYSKKIRIATQNYRNVYDEIAGRLQETVVGVRQVRIYNQEESENTRFLCRTARSLKENVNRRMSSVRLSTICMAIAGFGSTLICGLGAYFVLQGKITYGDLHAVNAYVWMAIHPTVRLTNMIAQMEETFVSISRIMDVLDESPDIVSAPDAVPMPDGAGRVEFDSVTFGYSSDLTLYEDVCLTVQPGQTVALVGATGCGKTSLTRLLMRQWDIQGGAIRIDGADIRDVTLRGLRNVFGVVLQDPVIFDGTFAENIAYGVPNASRDAVEAASRASEIHDTAMRLSDGYDTLLGNFGVKLSVGEKQRISIARAILRNPRILIMDEATSSLDSDSEALIQTALARVLKGRTSFIIAHRLSTITQADLIVVMDHGKIVEQGRHEALLAIEGGVYRNLYEQLLAGQAEDLQ